MSHKNPVGTEGKANNHGEKGQFANSSNLAFVSKNDQGADWKAKLAVLKSNAQSRQMFLGRGCQPRPDFCLGGWYGAADFTPAPDGQSGGHFRLFGFQCLDGEAARFEKFPPAGGCMAPDMSRI